MIINQKEQRWLRMEKINTDYKRRKSKTKTYKQTVGKNISVQLTESETRGKLAMSNTMPKDKYI